MDLHLSVENRSAEPIAARIGLELPTMLLGGGGNPAAGWEVDGRRSGHDSTGSATALATIAQGNDHLGIAVTSTLHPPADAWFAPIESISNSESGFERAYQGSGLLLSWLSRLGAGEGLSADTRHLVTVAIDRAADEATVR